MAHMAEILEQALDVALDKKDLKRRHERRLEREAKRSGEASQEEPRPYAMDTTIRMRLERELELPKRARSEARNLFILDNLAELSQSFQVPRHYTKGPKNYRRMSRDKRR